jgi:hypothetical protein
MIKKMAIRIGAIFVLIITAIIATPTAALSGRDTLADGFLIPQKSAKPWCYWWWLDSNATKAGITRDLEEMKRQGIAGALIFDAGKGTNPPNDDYKPRIRGGSDFDPVKGIGSPIGPLFMGPGWRELFKHAVKEANRLGIDLSFNISSGWDCGGTWVTPEHALHRFTWSKTIVQGPTTFSRELPQPPTTDGYYKDVSVLAFSLSKFTPLAMDKAGVTFTGSSTASPEFLALEFPDPFAAASLYIAPNRFCSSKGCELQVAEDGKNYTTICRFDLEAGTPKTVAFEEVKSRFYRVLLHPGGNGVFSPASAIWSRSGGQQSPWLVPVDDIQLLQKGEEARSAAKPGVHSRAAIDLVGKMDSSGRLSWSVPAGNWALFRFGQTIYDDGGWEKLTKLASPGAQGYEIDIMSPEAIDAQIAETAAKLASDIGPLAGKTLKYLHIDSWEAGEPNWTTHMVEEFKHRRGYDPTPYLAALTGTTVDSPEVNERFLRDLRRTVADLWADNLYGRFLAQARRWGMGVHAESGEWGPVSVMDSFMNFGRNDIPMGEFWIQDVDASLSVKLAASAAHSYGKRICQAEAFTSMGPNWEEDPWLLKKYVDPQFCAGLNRNMLCFYVHQPYLDVKPGYQWAAAGTHFDRNITWWEQSHAFFDYLSRCQFLLQQGRFVADVCYFVGEDAPSYCQIYNKIPAGYDNDSINGEVLMTRLSVKDGRLVLPDGMSYRILVLPQQLTMKPEAWNRLAVQSGHHVPLWPPQKTMTPELLRKVAALVEAGATVVGPRPTRSPSLEGYPACDVEVKTLADELWGPAEESGAGKSVPASEHSYGKGRVIWGKSVEQVLRENDVLPDFTCEGSPFDFIHRSMGGADIYFVSNNNDEVARAACTFRVSGRQPELWDPLNGQVRDAVAFTQQSGRRTTVPLEMEPRGSLFVVFRKPVPLAKNGAQAGNFPTFSQVMELKGPWRVKFDPKWGGPESVEFPELVDWTKRPEESIKYYSGKATYVATFELDTKPRRDPKPRICLDLGELKNLAEVRLNGKNLGVLWSKPFRVEITEAARNGKNDLEIDIVNLWPNRLIGDAWLPPEKWFCRTNVRKFTKDHPLLPSGLLGPVVLEFLAEPGK